MQAAGGADMAEAGEGADPPLEEAQEGWPMIAQEVLRSPLALGVELEIKTEGPEGGAVER